ncbi:Beta-lactamase_superfamily domain-containing protein [Hexamita inflata]|uniref:Beta-lactamase superfamily domain-containing protein n=1 Tax=Hexamita inflata TaxID=28002 RepID=A0AA86UJT7_9EUKA|nr:Beta-lactamase superfamily domain-containing protein [Hexamita inflata]
MSRKVNNRFVNICSDPALPSPVPVIRQYLTNLAYKPPTMKVAVENYQLLQNNQFAWLGHSSVLLKVGGKTVLIDPVFHSFPGTKRFPQDNQIKINVKIDYLLITHNHRDHMCMKTLRELKGRVGRVIVPLQNYKYIKYIFPKHMVTEMDWYQEINENRVKIQLLPARHQSNRFADQNKALWGSYCVNDDIYFSGDNCYCKKTMDQITARIKPKYCFLECGQYSKYWPDSHSTPKQCVEMFKYLQGQVLIPIHFGRFRLAFHEYNDPVIQLQNEKDVFVGQIGKIYPLGQTGIEQLWL